MTIVVFGLTISSSWGNGHATLWRGLCAGLAAEGVRVIFFERSTSYYAANRDLDHLPGGELVLYDDWEAVSPRARAAVAGAEATIVTSYCPDALAAQTLAREAGSGLCVFYDLDTPVTLARLAEPGGVAYIGPRGLVDYDLVLSYTGGAALTRLADALGARRVAPIYGHVDPQAHHPARRNPRYAADLSYLGTYAQDRQAALEALFIEPARRAPARRFLIGGSQYPDGFPWTDNIYFVRHLPPGEHPAFFSSCRLTLNVTRRAMAEMGWCPSGRLFEAAACGAPILSDDWEGLDAFFTPGEEILIARTSDEALAAVERSDVELARIADAARARVLRDHTSAARARTLLDALAAARVERAS